MSDGRADLVSCAEVIFQLDYSHFNLCGTSYATDGIDILPALLDAAFNNDGIGHDGSSITIVTPDQWNFEMPLRVDVWSAAPEVDLTAWAEAFEGHLELGNNGLLCLSPVDGLAEFAVAPGGYQALICASRSSGDNTDDAPPRHSWHVMLWPSDGPISASRLKPVSRERECDEPAPAAHLDAGRGAATRINLDLSGGVAARHLGDQNATAEASHTFRATREHLFEFAANLSWWTSGPFSGFGDGVKVGGGWKIIGNDIADDDFDGLPTGPAPDWTDEHGGPAYELRGTYVAVDRPHTVTTQVEWFRNGRPVLDVPTVLVTRLEDSVADDGQPLTTIVFEHSRVPAAWARDMDAIWLCKLESGDRVHGIAQ